MEDFVSKIAVALMIRQNGCERYNELSAGRIAYMLEEVTDALLNKYNVPHDVNDLHSMAELLVTSTPMGCAFHELPKQVLTYSNARQAVFDHTQPSVSGYDIDLGIQLCARLYNEYMRGVA